MDRDPGIAQFRDGDTAEDFANLVAAAVEGGQSVVRIPFEDFTLPDAIILFGTTEIRGQTIGLGDLFLGALKHFHQLEPSYSRAVETPDAGFMTPFSVSLEMVFENKD